MDNADVVEREGLGPVCDACHEPLLIHGATYRGAICDATAPLKGAARILARDVTRYLTHIAEAITERIPS